jgi:hypothetical protein
MSLPKLLDLINNCIKNDCIKRDDLDYILRKAKEWSVKENVVHELIKARKIKVIIPAEKQSEDSILKTLNADIQQKFKHWFENREYKLIISFFEDKLIKTIDSVLIQIYLKSLLLEVEYKKAYNYINAISPIDLTNKTETAELVIKVLVRNEYYERAFKINYDLYESKQTTDLTSLEHIARLMIENRHFDSLHFCTRLKNHLNIFTEGLHKYYSEKDYNSFILLYENYFPQNREIFSSYLWSLLKTEGLENKAYAVGIEHIEKGEYDDTINYTMGLVCSSIKKFKESYYFLTKYKENKQAAEEQIDNIISKLFRNKDWDNLIHFKEANAFQKNIVQAITLYNVDQDFKDVIILFEKFLPIESSKNFASKYVKSLNYINPNKALAKFYEFDSFYDHSNFEWLFLGGEINESNKNLKEAIHYYELADKLIPGKCEVAIKRNTHILYPDVHLTDLFESEKFQDVIQLFESKLSQTQEIRLIKLYIRALYRNSGTEEKALEKGILYVKSNANGFELYKLLYQICKFLKKHVQAKELILKAESFGIEISKELQEINLLIAKEEELEKKRLIEIKLKQKEEELKRIKELEKLKNDAFEAEKSALKEKAQKQISKQSISEESSHVNELGSVNEIQSESNSNENHHFKSSVTCGGDPVLPEHIFISNSEVRWEKKSGLFSKDSKAILIKDITQIEINTTLMCGSIIIRSSSIGNLHGENFSKSDVKQIKKILEGLR